MIDPRAVIDSQAQLAADVEVGAFAIIGAEVSIGPGCRIGPHAVIKGPTRLGSDNQVFQFASLGDAPQDKKYRGEPTRLEIGDHNTFREYCTVNRGTTHGGGVTRIGSDNWFMALYARRARLPDRGSLRPGEFCDAGRTRRTRRLGNHGGILRHPSVLQGRSALLSRQQHCGHARRAALL